MSVLAAVSAVSLARVDLPYPRSELPTGGDGALYVVSQANIAEKPDQVTLGTLAGMLARRTPRIYTIKSNSTALLPDSFDSDTTVFWMHDLAKYHGIAFDEAYLHDLPGLVRRFRPNITGYVWYDPRGPGTNAALIRCAASDGVIAAGTNGMAVLLAGLGIPMVANLSSSTPVSEFVRSKPRLSRRGIVAQPDDGSKSQCMSDYATFARIPTVEHRDGNNRAFSAVLANFDRTKLSAAFGWTSSDEHEFTASVTQAGGMVHASDYLYNLPVFSQLPQYRAPLPPRPSRAPALGLGPQPAPRRTHTVAFINSDGDNLQLLQNNWISSTHWNSPERGKQPAGWSYSPAMAELMPSLLAHVIRTSAKNDSLSAGPSGAGYAYPQLFSPPHRALFASATAELMQASGMTVANVIGVTPSEQSVKALAAEPDIAAIVYFTFGVASQGYAGLHGNAAYVGGTPVVGLRSNLWGNAASGDKVGVAGLVRNLKLLPKDPTDPRSYSIIVNELGNNFSEIAESARLLAEAGGFDVVLPEELIARLVGSSDASPL